MPPFSTLGKVLTISGALFLSGCAITGKPGVLTEAHWHLRPSSEFVARIPPPPATTSKETQRSIRKILALQAAATPQKMASARWTYEYSVFTYSLALSPSFTAMHYPRTAVFFKRLNDVVQRVNTDAKDHFHSPHPFQVDKRVKRFVHAVPGYDYPSYHSARCAVFQRVLGLLDPARKEKFIAVSQQVEQDRVFAGEHFPYSILAGKNLGQMIFEDLMRDPGFRADLSGLKAAEWTPSPASNDSF